MKSKTLPALLMALCLAACSSVPGAPAGGPPTHIAARVPDWPGGSGTVSVSASGMTLSQAPVGTDGAFNLPLPAGSSLTPYLKSLNVLDGLSPACTLDHKTVSGSGLVYTLHLLDVQAGGSDLESLVNQRLTGSEDATRKVQDEQQTYYVYASADLTADAAATCTGTGSGGGPYTEHFTVSLHLKAGWNLVRDHTHTETVKASGAETGQYDTEDAGSVDPADWVKANLI